MDAAAAYVLTNKHVAGSPGSRLAVHAAGKPTPAFVLALDPDVDLACLSAAAWPGAAAVPLAASSDLAGESAWAIGYPAGQGPRWRVLTFTARGPGNATFAGPAQGGESGSGVFRRGELVALVWGASHRGWPPATWTHTEAVPVEECRRFLLEICWPRLRKPPARPPSGGYYQPGSPGTPAPTPPAQAPAPPGPELGDLRKRLEDLAAGHGAHAGQLGDLAGKVKALEAGAAKVPAVLEALGKGLADAQAAGLLSGQQAQDLAARLAALAPVAGKVAEVAGKVAALEGPAASVAGLAGWLPAIAGGAAAGPLGLGLAVLGLFLRRKAVAMAAGPQAPGWTVGPPVQAAPAPPPVVVTQPAPPPQVVRTESNYVPYEAPSGELTALKQAMDALVQKHPGSVDTVETLKAWAAQIHSGQAKPKQ